jgi:hypothetical protein
MELIVRGLVALALIDCPPDAEVCEKGAAILIPDTSYFEKLGLHEHSATLSFPLSWIDAEHGHAGGYEVIDLGAEPMAVFTLEPGAHFGLIAPNDLGVRPMRGEAIRESNAAQNAHPLSQLLHAEELVETTRLELENVRNIIWIRSGRITTRALFGSGDEGPKPSSDLVFDSRGGSRFGARPLATEIVVELPQQGVNLERLTLVPETRTATPTGSVSRIRNPVQDRSIAQRTTAALSNTSVVFPSAPAPHLLALVRLLTDKKGVRAYLSGESSVEPRDQALRKTWYTCSICTATNPIRCPPMLIDNQTGCSPLALTGYCV